MDSESYYPLAVTCRVGVGKVSERIFWTSMLKIHVESLEAMSPEAIARWAAKSCWESYEAHNNEGLGNLQK